MDRGNDKAAEFAEDMPSLIRRAVAIAGTTCRGCAAFHGPWPARRAARAMRSVDSHHGVLGPLFRELAGSGVGNAWLIAGVADTGPLAMVAASLGDASRDLRFTVVDLCQTPLELCRDYAARTGLNVEVAPSDILKFRPDRPQNVVFGHSVLAHMPPDTRGKAVVCFRDWLAPGGVLVSVTSIDREPQPDPAAAEASIEALLACCRSIGVDDAATLRRLEFWRRERLADRVNAVRTVPAEGEMARLCADAGFAEIRCIPTTSSRPHRRPHDIVVARKAG
jgi:SAM-dependent methyltransferase